MATVLQIKDEGKETEAHQIKYLPSETECVRRGVMNKKSIDTKGVIWDRRLLVLTKERLLIVNANDPEHRILDFIHVRDIVECELKEDESPEKLEEKQLEVIIRTADCGRNKGRSYIYRSEYQGAVNWEAAIDKAVGNAKAKVREEHLQALYGHSFFGLALLL